MTLEQFQNLKIGDIVVAKLVNSKQSRVNPVTNIDRGNLKLHIGKSGKWRSYLQFEVLTADHVVKWIKRRTEQQKVRRQILFNMPYLLLTFLIKEKVLDSFLDGSSKYAYYKKINLELFYTKLRVPSMAIEYTLIWRHTKEGHRFWQKLNNKYKVYGK
jgi:hypothetical protein